MAVLVTNCKLLSMRNAYSPHKLCTNPCAPWSVMPMGAGFQVWLVVSGGSLGVGGRGLGTSRRGMRGNGMFFSYRGSSLKRT